MAKRTPVLAACAALVLTVAALASGCGSSGNDSGVASLGSQSSSNGANRGNGSSSSSSASEDPQDAALKWARCMRKNGVDVPDPQVDRGRITIRARGGAKTLGVRPESAKFRAATQKCGSPLGNARPPLSAADRQEFQDAALAFAKCMRDHGVDMPDPKFGQGGGLFQIGGPGSNVNPDSPRFQAAQKACDPIMQKLRDKIGGAGPSTTKGPQ